MHSQARKRSVIVAVTLELQCSYGHERLFVPTKLVHRTTDCGVNACVMMLQETQVEELQQSMEHSSAMAAQAQHGSCSSIVWRLEIMANHRWHVTGSYAPTLCCAVLHSAVHYLVSQVSIAWSLAGMCCAVRIARSCTGFARWVHHIETGPLQRATVSAVLWCAALCCAMLCLLRYAVLHSAVHYLISQFPVA